MNISAADFSKELSAQSDIHIIDVRSELEFSTFNIGGENIPLGNLPGALPDLELNNSENIIVLCQHGLRSETARRMMESAGYTNVKNLEGGLLAYRKFLQVKPADA